MKKAKDVIGTKTDISSKKQLILPNSENIRLEIERQQVLIRNKQKEVDEYNAGVYKIDPKFKNIRLKNGNIIVKFKKSKVAVKSKGLGKGTDFWTAVPSQKVVETDGGKYALIDNPLPYLSEGVIMAIDEEVTKGDQDLRPGVTVTMELGHQPRNMFYFDKTQVDTPPSDEQLIEGSFLIEFFPLHDGYFIIHYRMIEYVQA